MATREKASRKGWSNGPTCVEAPSLLHSFLPSFRAPGRARWVKIFTPRYQRLAALRSAAARNLPGSGDTTGI